VPLIGAGLIHPREAEAFEVVLQAGHTYLIDVQPTEPTVDFDLHIYDENNMLVSKDESTAADAYCAVTPRWTGPFRLVVVSARGSSPYQIRVQE
jgi:hypothetical protein